jgi:nitrogen regulatory protein PII
MFNPFKLDDIKAALERENLLRISVCEVHGAGRQQVYAKQYRGIGIGSIRLKSVSQYC